jgi:hypothetical protein
MDVDAEESAQPGALQRGSEHLGVHLIASTVVRIFIMSVEYASDAR